MTILARPHAAAGLMLLTAIVFSAASPAMTQEAKPDVIRIGSGAAGPHVRCPATTCSSIVASIGPSPKQAPLGMKTSSS